MARELNIGSHLNVAKPLENSDLKVTGSLVSPATDAPINLGRMLMGIKEKEVNLCAGGKKGVYTLGLSENPKAFTLQEREPKNSLF